MIPSLSVPSVWIGTSKDQGLNAGAVLILPHAKYFDEFVSWSASCNIYIHALKRCRHMWICNVTMHSMRSIAVSLLGVPITSCNVEYSQSSYIYHRTARICRTNWQSALNSVISASSSVSLKDIVAAIVLIVGRTEQQSHQRVQSQPPHNLLRSIEKEKINKWTAAFHRQSAPLCTF